MRVHVLHHATCFDGAASSAIFSAFYRARVTQSALFTYVPKQHRPGNPYAHGDFAADDVAVLDFRYTTEAALGWFFDHHKSAFQLAGEHDHFLRDVSGKKFHDANAPSCTGYIASIVRQHFGFDASPHEELLRWAEIIDTAAFPDPNMAVELVEPALRLMTFVEQNRDRDLVQQIIDDLKTTPLAKLAGASYVTAVVEPALERHSEDIALLRRRCRIVGGVAEYDLVDQPPRSYNKFIAYYLHPKIRYLVGVSTGPDGRIKLSAGYNPWLPANGREHDLAVLCERVGGGGHPYVGGASFDAEDVVPAKAAQVAISAILRGEQPP
jgi:hypothetical protein